MWGLHVHVKFVNVQASSKDVLLKLWGLVLLLPPCFKIFLSEKQMKIVDDCIYASTKNCSNLLRVIAFQGCVIICVTNFDCKSLLQCLLFPFVFVLRTFEAAPALLQLKL